MLCRVEGNPVSSSVVQDPRCTESSVVGDVEPCGMEACDNRQTFLLENHTNANVGLVHELRLVWL